MNFDRSIASVAAFANPPQFEDLRRNIDAEWIEQALHATGTATLRRRRLPAEQVVWLVIGMALFRNRSIHDVVSKLDLVLPGDTPTVVPSAVAEARARLGPEPMEWLFTRTADEWAHASARRNAWRGLAIYGVDGSTLRVPDSDENREAFGVSVAYRGESAYPLVRVAALMALRSHLLGAVSFGPYNDGEHRYASALWASVPDDSVTIVDRNYLAAPVLVPLQRSGRNRHWLVRAKSNTRWQVLRHLGEGDDLVELQVSSDSLSADPSLPKSYVARAVRYQRKGFQPQTLLTSLIDAEAFPADDVAALYHERWEIELGYDEIKTEMLDREEAIRSRTPEGVRQELWGILLAYNLIRLEMERVATDAKVDPSRISFVGAMRLICDEWLWCAIAQPGAIPKHLRNLRAALAGLILPPRRSERSYPRAVKIKMSNYPRKRRSARRAR
jgi:Insertion element 4 transposase N-terminal/Transposase DDE domain